MPDQHKIICPWSGWNLVRLLGQGTYGRVYLFKREEYGNTYFSAIKHISIPTDYNQTVNLFAEGLATDAITMKAYYTQLLQSFMNEININVELRGHINFVSYDDHQIIPCKEGPGYDIFIKMEYLSNLNSFLQQNPLKLADILRLGEDICTAMSVLQKRNLIHRDIKPENIFINKNGDFKLGDFGIVRSLDESVTRMSAWGALSFMAPELTRHDKSDFRIDLYSLGLVLYRLLNGNRAPFLPPLPTPVTHFEYNTAQDMRIRGEQLPPPAYADEKLSAIILRACAFDVNQRWRDAGQMRERLLEYDRLLSNKAKQTIVLDVSDKTTESDSPVLVRDAISVAGNKGPANIQNLYHNFAVKLQLLISTWLKVSAHIKGRRLVVAAFVAVLGLMFFLLLNTQNPQKTFSENEPQPFANNPYLLAEPMPVRFYDSAIESTIRRQLQKETGYIYPEELNSITKLRIESGSVESLQDLSSLPELVILDLKNQRLPDPSLLGKLQNLEVLNVSGCGLNDASFIEDLIHLTRLDISDNDLNDINFIKRLTHLIHLNISNNIISDLTPLAGLSKLEILYASNNPVLDWSAVDHIAVVSGTPRPTPPPQPSSAVAMPETETPITTPALPPTAEPEPTPTTTTAPTPTPEPAPKPTPTPEPTPSPKPTPTPTPTPEPTPKPTPAPTPTPEPTPKPTPTLEPTTTPKPTPAPEPEPAPTSTSTISVVEVKLSRVSLLLDIGGGSTLSATVSPDNATDSILVWSSSNPSIATVDSNGNVKAVGPGTASITVTCGGLRARCSVTVN